MAKRSSTKRTHVSPGMYFKETTITPTTKSMGITTLGLAGETVKGPAFQSIPISDWREFQTYFGGTNTEKFRGSQYPKYELPYIAQEYLKQSKQLEVVRTLGLSGVNAGPAWVITATKHICKQGYQYEPSLDSNDDIELYGTGVGIKNRGVKQDVGKMLFEYTDSSTQTSYFSYLEPPQPVFEESQPSETTIGVIDAFVNTDFDIVYFDDNAEDLFDKLPEGIKTEFGTFAELKRYFTDPISNDPRPFFYVDLENKLFDGDLAITFTLDNKSVVTFMYNDISNANCITAQHSTSDTIYTDTNYTNDQGKLPTTHAYIDSEKHRYILLSEKDLIQALKGTESGGVYNGEFPDLTDADLVKKNFKIYQTNYTNLDANNEQIVEQSGLTYKYKLSDKKEICIEDVNSEYNNVVVAILRSRGIHTKNKQVSTDECGNPVYTYDGINYFAKKVTLKPSTTLTLGDNCNPGYNTLTGDFNINNFNYGKFTIEVDSDNGCPSCGVPNIVKNEYSVSLNPNDKNYITKVLGTNPEIGDADIYVEELYDVALAQLIQEGKINAINHEIVKFPYVSIVPEHADVDDLITVDSTQLTKKDLGKRYIYTYTESLQNSITVKVSLDGGTTWQDRLGIVGHIYTVKSMTNQQTGKKEYFYAEYRDSNDGILKGSSKFTEFLTLYQYNRDVVKNDFVLSNCVKVKSDNSYYIYTDFDSADTANEGEVKPITLDFNNYKEEYRYSSTPWIVSELKGSGNNINLHKLFRFHTISDGNNSINEVKVSIENIDPEAECFDVIIRDFYDTDIKPNVYERFGKCTLKVGDANYLGLKIGTIDGVFVSQSAYVTVEINEDDITAVSIPCGFLGYPVRNYNGVGLFDVEGNDRISTNIKQPYVKFNTTLDQDLSVKKQYFGMSDLIGIDEDILKYKGVEAYNDMPEYLTPCFHLDSRILNGSPTGIENGAYYVEEDNNKQFVSVDGITGYNWITVSRNETTQYGIEPRIGIEDVMDCTIYEDKSARKFTVCFYGGWDGWDYYRTSRSNSDDFRYNKYKGNINKSSNQGSMFSLLSNPETYGFDANTKAITSDYYAYLAAVRQLDNPKTIAINLFATPGIDYVNQTSLVNDIIEIIEEERGDSVYVVTTPDKPFGAGDSKSEMYTPEEAVANLEDADIDSNYACTYYPWVQYYDTTNNQYIYLPLTLDVVRNMAYTDNIVQPWYASAGWNRGDISGVGPRRKLKIAEQDILYNGRINYVNSFAQKGNKVWGDKNLQLIDDNLMNRISKRRLLIRIKELLANACVDLFFDPNDVSMARTFENRLKNTLNPIKENRGIVDYKIEIDDSDEARDRLEIPGKVQLKPTPTLEYITLELAMTPTGVSFQ